MSLRRLLLVPSTFVVALVIALALAGGANAEIFKGEATFAEMPSISREADVVAGRAEFDPTFGRMLFTVTTAAPPLAERGGEPSFYALSASLFDTTGGCDLASLEHNDLVPPVVALTALYRNPYGTAYLENPPEPVGEPDGFPSKLVSGSTTTLAYTSLNTIGKEFNCASLTTFFEGTKQKSVFFPIAAPSPPPPAEPASSGSQGSTSSSPSPSAAPSAPPTQPGKPILSIAKPKPLTLAGGKWRTVKLTITNTGTAGIDRGSLRVKAPQGISVQPEKQQLPALAPGRSWTVSVRVQPTKRAKQKSTLPVIASAPGATSVTGSLVLKLKE